MNSHRRKLYSLIALHLQMLWGCTSISPHENFRQHLNTQVGMSIDNAPAYSWRNQKDLIEIAPLPNGNLEYTYKYLRTCRYIFEVNPKTHIIVGARFEGKETDCVVAP
jgi:hypothetical protein